MAICYVSEWIIKVDTKKKKWKEHENHITNVLVMRAIPLTIG